MNQTLRHELLRLLGPDGFSDTPEDCLSYAYDATGKQYQYLPDAVVFPQTVEQIAGVLKTANRHRLPVVPRGAGSGLTCGALAEQGGLVLVMAGFDRILEIDADNMFAVVEPGVVTARLHAAVERQGLFYPPDPASTDFCTLGGNIAENAGGMRAVKYGVTRDYVMGLEVVLPSGEVVQTGSKCIKDVVGYDLTTLFVGSEGTLGIITRAILKLLPLPAARQAMTAAFPTLRQAGQTIPAIIRSGVVPATIEFMDRHCIRAVENHLKAGLPPEAQAFLIMDVDGSAAEVGTLAAKVDAICRANGAFQVQVARNENDRERLWKIRRSISVSLGNLPVRGAGEDIVVPRTQIPAIIEKMESITARYGLYTVNFGHAGDGNIHVSLVEKDGPVSDAQVDAASREILKTTVALDGRIAAEHGIGLLKRDKIGWNLDAATLKLMQRMKKVMDPNNILNPGKIFPLKEA